MNKKYEDIFKKLVKSYYNGSFDKTIEEIISNSDESKENTLKAVSSLCGVDIDINDPNYIYLLKKAITTHKVRENIVQKISACSHQCINTDNDKPKCQSACPFDAILVDPLNNSTYIDNDLCTNCGVCVEVCDSGLFLDKVEFLPIMDLLNNNEKVIAAVAPAIMGQFGENVSLDQLREAFVKVGFSDMIEVAFAADMLTIKEAVEFDKHINNKGDIMITSCCCPMWVGMLKRVYNNLVKDVSPSVSPMIAAGRVLKSLDKDAKVVFIGPCIAKKAEAKEKDLQGDVDFVLTFQELKGIFDVLGINPSELKGIPSLEYASKGGRLYARTGGVSIAVSECIEELFPEKYKVFKAIQANGVKECKEMLSKAENGEIDANFIEGMGCVGGCVGGPKRLIPKEEGKVHVDNLAFASPIKVATHSNTMNEILKKLSINSLDDFKDEYKIEIFEREFK